MRAILAEAISFGASISAGCWLGFGIRSLQKEQEGWAIIDFLTCAVIVGIVLLFKQI